jgi:hypothetical protein
MTTPAREPVSTAQIAALLAWARSLSQAGGAADPDQRAAYQPANTTLVTRLAGHPDTSQPPTKDDL